MDLLKKSWNNFNQSTASAYLVNYGHPSERSKRMIYSILVKKFKSKKIKLLDVGCGNGNLLSGLDSDNIDYTGVDFSKPLINSGRKTYPNTRFIVDDVNKLDKVKGYFDIIIYRHVLELLASPESSLKAVSRRAKLVLINFYEPPVFDDDIVELKTMDLGDGKKVPFIRRKISNDYYRMLLYKIGCKKVEVYKDFSSKDQIHLLYF